MICSPKLGAATRNCNGAKNRTPPRQIGDLNDRSKPCGAALRWMTALAVPYTEEELGAVPAPEPQLASPGTEKKSIKGTARRFGQLVAEAQRFLPRNNTTKPGEIIRGFCSTMQTTRSRWGPRRDRDEQGKLDEAESI